MVLYKDRLNMHRKPGTLHLILRTFPMYSQMKFLVPYICVIRVIRKVS